MKKVKMLMIGLMLSVGIIGCQKDNPEPIEEPIIEEEEVIEEPEEELYSIRMAWTGGWGFRGVYKNIQIITPDSDTLLFQSRNESEKILEDVIPGSRIMVYGTISSDVEYRGEYGCDLYKNQKLIYRDFLKGQTPNNLFSNYKFSSFNWRID